MFAQQLLGGVVSKAKIRKHNVKASLMSQLFPLSYTAEAPRKLLLCNLSGLLFGLEGWKPPSSISFPRGIKGKADGSLVYTAEMARWLQKSLKCSIKRNERNEENRYFFAPCFLIFIFKVQNCACAAFILLKKCLCSVAQAQFCTGK